MANRDLPRDRGTRKARRILADLGRDLRDARVSAGLSQAFVARSAGIARSTLSLIERNLAADLTLLHPGAIAAVLGLELSVKLYPAGAAVRDIGQIRLMARFRKLVGEGFGWIYERGMADPRADGLLLI
jgi:transcriptional regulator with XRE-family HTH domain